MVNKIDNRINYSKFEMPLNMKNIKIKTKTTRHGHSCNIKKKRKIIIIIIEDIQGLLRLGSVKVTIYFQSV